MALIATIVLAASSTAPSRADEAPLPAYLADRGTGVSMSQFGTFVRGGELLVYPFYEYTRNNDEEYKPAELGFGLEEDFRARRTDHEALLWVAYGITQDLAIEVESALWTTATQWKAPSDPSAMPARLKESGLGDTEGQLRWRAWRETERRPELFSYFEAVLPLQKERRLIGTQEWELAQGVGLIKGTRWGTFSGRLAVSHSDGVTELGEYDVEYLKRTSPHWRWLLSLEGEQDEIALIAEAQIHLGPRAFVKLNNGFGVTSKAPDVAPEVGVVFSFDPGGR